MDLRAYMQPPVSNETKTVYPSKRFVGPDGNPAPFVIRVIDQETNNRLISKCMEWRKVDGRKVRGLNEEKYANLLMLECVVEPDIRNSEICKYYDTVDPAGVLSRMLSVGEYNRLANEIRKLNEIATTQDEYDELDEQAKN